MFSILEKVIKGPNSSATSVALLILACYFPIAGPKELSRFVLNLSKFHASLPSEKLAHRVYLYRIYQLSNSHIFNMIVPIFHVDHPTN
jgi:hypothetical protein